VAVLHSIKTIIAVLTLSVAVFAAPVSFEKASQVAENAAKSKKLNLKHKSFKKRGAKPMYAPAPDASAPAAVAEDALLYVFQNDKDKGFVIVSGDDVFSPIIGISDKGTYDPANLPPNFAWYVENIEREMEFALENGQAQTQDIRDEWMLYAAGDAYVVGDYLIKTKWDQEAPYWNKTPAIGGQQTYTGCVATAMAQIMNYHQYPASSTFAIPAYTTTDGLSVSALPTVTFDWNNMTNTYTAGSTAVQKDAVATLMNAAGRSVKMNYRTDGSGALSSQVPIALKTYFDYDNKAQYIKRDQNPDLDWIGLLKDQIDDGLPVFYDGNGSNVNDGHAFVLDGYNSSNNFHINWGWGGNSDGFYAITVSSSSGLNPSNSSNGPYSYNQGAVINIIPRGNNSPGYSVLQNGLSFTIIKVNGGRFGNLQLAMNFIKANADGADCSIQFEDGTTELDIDTESITFDGGSLGTDWGEITLSGKITSAATRTISLSNGVSVESGADITNTASGGYAIDNSGSGTVTIIGGTILASGSSGSAISNSSGTVNITDGTISASRYAIYNFGSVTINDGTISASGSSGYAIYNGTGNIAIADGIISVSGSSGRAIYNGSGTITITDGTISAFGSSGYAIDNGSGTITIADGIISASGSSGRAIYNSAGTINITDGTISASSSAILNFASGTVDITGGTISASDSSGVAIYNSAGTVSITSGTISASGLSSRAIENSGGTINITGGTISESYMAIYNSNSGTVSVTGGIISTPDSSGRAIYNSTGTVNITGGTISASGSSGNAIFNRSGTITITDGTISASGLSGRAIYNSNSGTGTITIAGGTISESYIAIYNPDSGIVSITGGTISASNYAIYNYNSGTVSIAGGNISVSDSAGRAIYNYSQTGSVILGGSPDITGRIRVYAEKLSVIASGDTVFNPGDKQYELEFASYSNNMIAVQNGAVFADNFTLNRLGWGLAVEGDNIVIVPAYTVTFRDWNNTTLKTQFVNHGSAATAPADPTREGYTFTGWNVEFDNVTSNLTVTARYTIITYTVTFVGWDSTMLKTQTVNHGTAATAPTAPTRAGYTFTGWDAEFSNVTSNLTIRAQYEAETPILPQIATNNLLTQTRSGINLTAKTNTIIEVYNLSGKLISRQNYIAGSHSISFGHLPKGMYIVKATFGSEKQVLRVPVR